MYNSGDSESGSLIHPAPRGRVLGVVDRRTFLITSAAGAAGLAAYPFRIAYASPVFAAVARFAAAVGASVLSSLITDYSRRYLNPSTAREVGWANNTMAQQGGFSDLSESKVYVPQPEPSYFFYPARNVDKFNTCVAFFDSSYNQNSRRIALIEGPTLFGISELAHTISQRQTSGVVRNAMLPREAIRVGRGTIDRGYDDDDVYRTDSGTVRSHYVTDGNGKGTVTVTARNESGTLLARGDYDLAYNKD